MFKLLWAMRMKEKITILLVMLSIVLIMSCPPQPSDPGNDPVPSPPEDSLKTKQSVLGYE